MEKPNFRPNSAGESASKDSGERKTKIGALWNRQSQKGQSFFSGQLIITDEFKLKLENAPLDKYGNKIIDVLVFNNNFKDQANQPDYRIVLGDPKRS